MVSAQRSETCPDIDWGAPWLAPLAARGQAVARAWAAGQALHAALNARLQAPVRFVPQDALGARQTYEMHVAACGQVPTRDNRHDLFNGLAWGLWPHLKSRLNALHAQALAADAREATRRGPLRDALTLWDENGAIWLAPEPLWQALRAHDWQRLWVTERARWAETKLWLVGHALMEQLVTPRKGLTAHVWLMPREENAHALRLLHSAGEAAAQAWLDARIGAALQAQDLQPKPFTPLPVLGVPGWWPANEDPAFYDDAQVFRPQRRVPPEAVRWITRP